MLILQDEYHGILKMALDSSELSPFCSVALRSFSFSVHQPKALTVPGHSFVTITRSLGVQELSLERGEQEIQRVPEHTNTRTI